MNPLIRSNNNKENFKKNNKELKRNKNNHKEDCKKSILIIK